MEENQNGVFRHRRTNFSAVSNMALQDERLSLKAKGLYSLIQCYNGKPNYRLYKRNLLKLCKEGSKAFDSAWKELKDTGYLKIYRIPSGDNDRFKYEYDLLDEPDLDTPSLINLNKKGEVIPPKAPNISKKAMPAPENPHTPQKGVYANSDISHAPLFVPNANGNICEPHPMPNGGERRNTDPRNTDLRNIESIIPSDGSIDKLREGLKEQIEYEYFEENCPEDIAGIETIVGCMADMLTSPSTKISGVVQSREALKTYIDRVDSCTLREFMQDMKSKDLSEVKNVNAYWRSSFINFLRAQELLKLQI
ncbi:hypothetical protein [Caproiciproducens faecalis]|uniref:Helix-turn-helix domain-containing protein n=1 Tax=Caproiciproducens faecalis TaxID=2820301 RepID=A0ABS7DPG0_9FIRM|nr:hypothetical protein [Caproiciproducens faecalis]MBW7573189.1 hypothetical protein [Caproiciproducens faecalis]